MATDQQIEYVLRHLQTDHPSALFQRMRDTGAGLAAVLRILEEAPGEVTSGQISEAMQVSTARVAVLLKKMAARGLIAKYADPRDARVTMVRLSPAGKDLVRQMKQDLYTQVGSVIDRLGMEKIQVFLSISQEIQAALSPPKLNL